MLSLLNVIGAEKAFFSLNKNEGLSDNCVYQILQLQDGRILVYTQGGVNIYDCTQFSFIHKKDSCRLSLKGYDGRTHLYVDSEERLWIKDWHSVSVVNLSTYRYFDNPKQLLSEIGVKQTVSDLYIDSYHRLWVIFGNKLTLVSSNKHFILDNQLGTVQDLETISGRLYVFFSLGSVVCYDIASTKRLYSSAAYDINTAQTYRLTSLVALGHDGFLYQIRTGTGGRSIFLRLNPRTGVWKTIYVSPQILHTLVVASANTAYISTTDGYLRFNLYTLQSEHLSSLRLPDGSLLHTGLNTVCIDREGGVWLGTYNKGVLYASPTSGVFDTRHINVPVKPVLIDLFLHGKRLIAGDERDGHVIMPVEAPCLKAITLQHNDNALAFRFSAMNFARPRDTHYRFRLDNDDWMEVSADSSGSFVDNRGTLYLSYAGLAPGKYRLEVEASTDGHNWRGGVYTLHFTILPPWWLTWWAIIIYVFIAIAIIFVAFLVYSRNVKLRMERQNHEEMLMMRIKELLDKSQPADDGYHVVLSEPEKDNSPQMSHQDMEFMSRATDLVEKNIANGQYNVEMLSRDLCMERTGLYKKLTTLLDQSPVAFIRTIRLRKAAELLREGNHSVSEVSELTGFSSSSYFSKCFFKEYGCKPSEYK